MRKFVIFVGVFFALLGTLLSIDFFLDTEHHNLGFYEFPAVIGAHVFLGGAYLILGVHQFAGTQRRSHPGLHRLVGRVAVVMGMVVAATAIMATVLFPYSGRLMIFFVAPFAVYFGVALLRGY